MTIRRSMRGRASERGEGNAKLIAVLLIMALAGYLGTRRVLVVAPLGVLRALS